MKSRPLDFSRRAASPRRRGLAGCMQFDDGLSADRRSQTHVAGLARRDHLPGPGRPLRRRRPGTTTTSTRRARQLPRRRLAGREDHLDYIEALGVTTLWISPVVKNVETDAGFDGYHGYWTQDFTQPNPHFGDLAALRELVDAAHAKDMKVILDIVTNHMGQLFYYDINENGQPDDTSAAAGDPRPHRSTRSGRPRTSTSTIPTSIRAACRRAPRSATRGRRRSSSSTIRRPTTCRRSRRSSRTRRRLQPARAAPSTSLRDQLIHGDFPGGLKDVDTTRCDVKQAMIDAYAPGSSRRLRRLPHRHREARRARVLALLHPEGAPAARQATARRTSSCSARRSTATTSSSAPSPRTHALLRRPSSLARDESTCVQRRHPAHRRSARQRLLLPAVLTRRSATSSSNARGTQQIRTSGTQRPMQLRAPPPGGRYRDSRRNEVLVNFLDNHDVPRFLFSGRTRRRSTTRSSSSSPSRAFPASITATSRSFEGGNDPANREDLWHDAATSTDGDIFQWIQKLTAHPEEVQGRSPTATRRWSGRSTTHRRRGRRRHLRLRARGRRRGRRLRARGDQHQP